MLERVAFKNITLLPKSSGDVFQSSAITMYNGSGLLMQVCQSHPLPLHAWLCASVLLQYGLSRHAGCFFHAEGSEEITHCS